MNPGDPKTLDPYRYADNNPVLFTDPTGLNPFSDFVSGFYSEAGDTVVDYWHHTVWCAAVDNSSFTETWRADYGGFVELKDEKGLGTALNDTLNPVKMVIDAGERTADAISAGDWKNAGRAYFQTVSAAVAVGTVVYGYVSILQSLVSRLALLSELAAKPPIVLPATEPLTAAQLQAQASAAALAAGEGTGTASVLQTANGKVYPGMSGQLKLEQLMPELRRAVEAANAARGGTYNTAGFCGEICAANKALLARESLAGSKIATAAIGKTTPGAGLMKGPCYICHTVLKQMGATFVTKKAV